jgi:hypothetical protein
MVRQARAEAHQRAHVTIWLSLQAVKRLAALGGASPDMADIPRRGTNPVP